MGIAIPFIRESAVPGSVRSRASECRKHYGRDCIAQYLQSEQSYHSRGFHLHPRSRSEVSTTQLVRHNEQSHMCCSVAFIIFMNSQMIGIPSTDLQSQIKIIKFFYFWPVSSSSQCCLLQLTYQILHTNIGRAFRIQSVKCPNNFD